MIKLTYSELMGFNSPVISKLLSSDDRRFPVEAAIQIADIVNQVQPKIKVYHEQAKKAVEQNGGAIEKNGAVKYMTDDIRLKVESELNKLNSVEVELTGNLLEKTDNWPDLSIHEAMILRPIINVNGKSE